MNYSWPTAQDDYEKDGLQKTPNGYLSLLFFDE